MPMLIADLYIPTFIPIPTMHIVYSLEQAYSWDEDNGYTRSSLIGVCQEVLLTRRRQILLRGRIANTFTRLVSARLPFYKYYTYWSILLIKVRLYRWFIPPRGELEQDVGCYPPNRNTLTPPRFFLYGYTIIALLFSLVSVGWIMELQVIRPI